MRKHDILKAILMGILAFFVILYAIRWLQADSDCIQVHCPPAHTTPIGKWIDSIPLPSSK